MQLKTPKRYRPNRRERRIVGSWRGIRNLILVGLLGVAGYWIYTNQTLARQTFDGWQQSVNEQLPTLQAAIPQAPTPTTDVTNVLITADAAYQTGDFPRAIESYQEVIRGAPNDLESHTRLAMLLVITSDLGENTAQLDQAVELATLAINADPEAPQGWAVKAMALGWRGQNGEALAYAERAIEIDPNFVQAKAYLAEAYWRLDNRELAQTTIDEAVAFLRGLGSASPETVAAVFRAQGFIAERQLDRETAIAAYETARQAAPTHSYIALELALSYFGNGQTDEAIVLLNQALDASPRNSALLNQLGRMYVNIGNNDDALQTFQRCIEADPNFAPCLSWLGGLQFASGTYAVATTNLQAAIDNGSTDWSDWLQLGLAHTYMLRCDLAIPILREGFMMVQDNVERQDRFATALRECGVQPFENAAVPAPLNPTLDPANELINSTPES